MSIPSLRPGVAQALSRHHKEIDSLSYTTSALFIIAILVTALSLLVILTAGIYSNVTKRAFYKPLLLPTLVPLACTTPIFVLGTMRQRELTENRETLFTVMHKELALHKKLSVKKLTRFIERYLIEDSYDPKIFWHRTYKDHLITQLEAKNAAAKNNIPNIKKALAKAKKNLTKELEKLAENS